jgi:hypothetical protein
LFIGFQAVYITFIALFTQISRSLKIFIQLIMKNLLFLIAFLAAPSVFASTSRSSATVSGHWTLSGSPYLIYNDISISGGASLTVDPGVSVVFQGAYKLNVDGMLIATGTEALPITLNVNDTTGWWDSSVATGGWHGIQFQPFSGTGTDSSILAYCDIEHTKFDSADAMAIPTITTLYVQRALKVTHCTFSHNKSKFNYMLFVYTAAGQLFELDASAVSYNQFSRPVLLFNNFVGGGTHMHDSKVYNNQSDNVIMQCDAVDMVMEHNEFHSNASSSGTITFVGTLSGTTVRDCHAIVRYNKIYENTNIFDAALVCFGGIIDINSNLICNNQHSSGTCGYIDGGGGINISFNTPGPIDSTFYTVRNNVIANNYSPFHGGGISIFDARSVIANNQIINNSSADGGAVYIYNDFETVFRNNIFYGNLTLPDLTSANSPNLAGHVSTNIGYDHNWTEHNSLFDLNLGTSFTITGDTATNLTGTDPGLVAPTLTSSVSDLASSADFSLLTTSPCLDAGDTTGARAYVTDYAGHPRIQGAAIEIGAFELDPVTLGAPALAALNGDFVIYPNPAYATLTVVAKQPVSKLSICTITGQVIATFAPHAAHTDLSVNGLIPGIYLLMADGQYIGRFVKQ